MAKERLLTPIDPNEIPGSKNKKAPTRLFAEKVVSQLSAHELQRVGAFEVTSIPNNIKPSAIATLLRTVLCDPSTPRLPAKVMQRKDRVFIVYEERKAVKVVNTQAPQKDLVDMILERRAHNKAKAVNS